MKCAKKAFVAGFSDFLSGLGETNIISVEDDFD